MESLNVLDLFSGCGGLSLGLKRAGLNVVAAIDNDKHATAVYKENFPDTPVFCEDLKRFSPGELKSRIEDIQIDIVAGGPPCQGFSIMRQLNGSNHGKRLIEDKRRYLYKDFLKYVEFFNPRMFVMENVRGIKTAASGKVFDSILEESSSIGYKIENTVLKAKDYSIPQKRIREIIIGIRKDLLIPSIIEGLFNDEKTGQKFLWEAIGDLPILKAGERKTAFSNRRRENHIKTYGTSYIRDVLKNHIKVCETTCVESVPEVNKTELLTSHEARPHSKRDLRDFARLKQGETGQQALKRGEKMEYPYNRDIFKDRYTRQHRNRLCSTIVAHLSKDGLMFIHPTQNRSLTPREAARVQSFPDWFVFCAPRTHQFQMIGNAVPPLLGEVIGVVACNYLRISNDHFEKTSVEPNQEIQIAV